MNARLLTLIIGLMLSPGIIALGADDCAPVCNNGRLVCLSAAKTDFASCRLNCRTAGSGRDRRRCVRGCSVTWRTDKLACIENQTSCVNDCTPTSVENCPAACNAELERCGRDVIKLAQGCRSLCRKSPERKPCVAGCNVAQMMAMAGCQETHAECGEACVTGSDGGDHGDDGDDGVSDGSQDDGGQDDGGQDDGDRDDGDHHDDDGDRGGDDHDDRSEDAE